jgi:hypothetical protein
VRRAQAFGAAVILFTAVFILLAGEATAYDFRDLSLGDPVEKLGLQLLVERQGRVEVYQRQNEVAQLGSVGVESVRYSFFDGRMFRIEVNYRFEHKAAVMDMLNAKYGPAGKDGLWRSPSGAVIERDMFRFSITDTDLANRAREAQAQDNARTW